MDFDLLAKYGIRYPKSAIANSAAQAAEEAAAIGFPVALKILSPQVLHKTDRGGVILEVESAKEAEAAYQLLMERFKANKVEGVLVQQMAGKGAVELIIGGKRDSQFGQMIMLGMGGIYVEVLRDFTFRVCPVAKDDAEQMISDLRSYPILAGARGRKPVDRKALVNTLLSVSKLLLAENPKEFDLNPLMADEKGCVAVDMRLLK